MRRDYNIRLPWQFVLLAFLAFIALFVGMMVFLSFVDSSGMDRALLQGLHWFGIPYMLSVVAVTPILVVGGRQTMRRWREAERQSRQRSVEGTDSWAIGDLLPYEPTTADASPALPSSQRRLLASSIGLVALAATVLIMIFGLVGR